MNKFWKIIIYIELTTLVFPVTLFYLWGLFLITSIPLANKVGVFEPDVLVLPSILLIPGAGLLTLWILAIKYEVYAKTKIPIAISIGIAMGVISIVFFISKVGFGFILEPNLFYWYGGGPLVTLVTVLLVIRRVRNNLAPNQALNRTHDKSRAG